MDSFMGSQVIGQKRNLKKKKFIKFMIDWPHKVFFRRVMQVIQGWYHYFSISSIELRLQPIS